MTAEPLMLVERAADGAVAHLRFNRPAALNALDVPLARAFAQAVDEATSDPTVRAIVLSGAGRGFVAGGDVASFAADFDRAGEVVAALLDALNPAILRLRENDAPVIAAVRGVAAGAGFALMTAADLVVADDKARFVVAYDKVGAAPDCGGTWFLPRRVGRARAMELMLLGDAVDAPRALSIGLVNEILPADQVEARALDLAARIAAGPTRAYGKFRRLVDAAFETPLGEQLAAEKAAFVATTGTADFREGVSAFLAKRPPVFSGK